MAVIGSGPAGIVVAIKLAQAGCAVTVFEQRAEIDDVLEYGIPDFRLPRTALRQGARNVTIYARSKHVSASSDEVEFAQLDGAELVYGKAIQEIDGNGPVFRTAIFDEEDAVVGYEDELDHVSCDTVVIAASQQAKDKLVLTTDALVANDRGLLEVDENGMTMMSGVFAAGDVVSGPSTVVHAVAGTNRAVAGIMSYLGI